MFGECRLVFCGAVCVFLCVPVSVLSCVFIGRSLEKWGEDLLFGLGNKMGIYFFA